MGILRDITPPRNEPRDTAVIPLSAESLITLYVIVSFDPRKGQVLRKHSLYGENNSLGFIEAVRQCYNMIVGL